jgi:hypothetical protein
MVNKTSILKNLLQLERYFNTASSSRSPSENRKLLYYSKLAILELCGWTEESMDDIVLTCSRRYLTVADNQDDVEEVVRRTWGFNYSGDFRKMLIHVMGIVNVERLESSIDSVKLHQMKSEFGHLQPDRNIHSHTHIRGTPRIDSPTVTIRRFCHIYSCLKDIEHCIQKMYF